MGAPLYNGLAMWGFPEMQKAHDEAHEAALEPYAPDINAPTERVLSPAPDGVVDWKKIGELLDLE